MPDTPLTPDTAIDLDELVAAQLAAIGAGGFGVTAEAYDPDRREFALPACMVRVADFERDSAGDIGTEQLAMLARFEAHIVVGFRETQAYLAAPRLALAVARLIEGNRFGQPVSPAQVSVVEPDEFAPDLDRFVVWRIDFAQVIHVGASIWTNDGTLPQRVVSSWSPEIGTDYADDYETVLGDPGE